MGVLNPIYSLFLLLTLPVIALYLLRPKSKKMKVASNFLWTKTLENNDIQRLDKRLIRNWLFYLQLAILIAGAFLLMHPFLNQLRINSKDLVVVIDTSASMSTHLDEVSRLDEAKEASMALIKGLEGKPSISVYALSDEMDLIYKGQKPLAALDAIEGLVVTEKSGNSKVLETYLDAYTLSEVDGGLYIFTDHVYIENPSVNYYLSTKGDNKLGILRASHRRGQEEDYLQASLKNYSQETLEGDLMLYGDDELLKILPLKLEAGANELVKINTEKFATAYRLKWSGQDDYILDNTYYLGVQNKKRNRLLLVGESNRFLEEALMILPNVEVYKTDKVEIKDAYDLYIYNGVLPQELPLSGSCMMINPKVDRPYLQVGREYSQGSLVFEGEDEIWRHVNTSFNVRKVRAIDGIVGKSIMTIDGQAVIVKGQIESCPSLVIGFDLLETDFPMRIGFPVFMHNAASYLVGNLSQDDMNGYVGQELTIRGNPMAKNRYILNSNGDKETLEDAYELVIDTEQSGHYLLVESDEKGQLENRLLSINVARDESENIAHVQSGQILAQSSEALGHRSLKPFIVVLLIVLLFIEWWVYYRGY